MVTVRKVKQEDREYWIFIHSVRDGKKIIQKSKYIGKRLPKKERLERMKKEFLEELRGRRSHKFFSEEEIRKIEDKKRIYQKDLAKLTELEKEKSLEEFIIRFTYDSSKLSGVDITLRQTSLILKEGLIPKGFKHLRTAREIENHEKGVLAITKYKGSLDIIFVKKLHKILFSGVADEIAGRLRSELKKDVKIAGTPYIPPKWQEIDRDLDQFFKWYKAEQRKIHPLELAALVHLKLISLQPFTDGNSRLSRLLMNWVLWKKNYPMVDIPVEDLENYYNALDIYQIEKREKPFVEYIKEKYFAK